MSVTPHQDCEETPWIDAWVRWEMGSKEIYSTTNEDDSTASLPPPTDTFSFRYSRSDHGISRRGEDDAIELELRGFGSDTEQIWNSTGLTLWRSSRHLCEHLLQHANELESVDRILEVRACKSWRISEAISHSLPAWLWLGALWAACPSPVTWI